MSLRQALLLVIFGTLLELMAEALDKHYRLTQIELDLLLRRKR